MSIEHLPTINDFRDGRDELLIFFGLELNEGVRRNWVEMIQQQAQVITKDEVDKVKRVLVDVLLALHGGKGAQPLALPSNLRFFADKIEAGGITPISTSLIVDCLRKYAAGLEGAVKTIEGSLGAGERSEQ